MAYQEFASSAKTTYLVETSQPESGSLMAPFPLEGSYHIAFLGRSVIIMAYQIEGGQKWLRTNKDTKAGQTLKRGK